MSGKINIKMKQTIRILTLASIIILMVFPFRTYAQQKTPNLRHQNELWNLWTIEANTGFLSFYGDLSSHDHSYLEKIKYESGGALSLNLSKHFNRLFSISGQILAGKLNGNNFSTSFQAKLIEYNLNVKLNIFNLFYPNNKGNFGITGQAGLGQFLFSSIKSEYNEGGPVLTKHDARVPEFVYFIGAGGFIKTTDRFGISLDFSLRQCQNDWLDVLVINNDSDYYTYLSLGLIYYMDRFKKGPIKNKARIAHNNVKFKHL